MSGAHLLFQYGADPFNTHFVDVERHVAFTVKAVDENPNLVIKITREERWYTQHQSQIKGSSSSFLYFGPSHAPGYLVYGNGATQPMMRCMRQQRDGSTSRYFTAQNNKDYKWRISPKRMECVEGRSIIAVWERSDSENMPFAQLTLNPSALPIVTEVLTTLMLNRMALALNWETS